MSYFRPSDYVFWGGATAAFPSSLYLMGEDPAEERSGASVVRANQLTKYSFIHSRLHRDVGPYQASPRGHVRRTETRHFPRSRRWIPVCIPEVIQ